MGDRTDAGAMSPRKPTPKGSAKPKAKPRGQRQLPSETPPRLTSTRLWWLLAAVALLAGAGVLTVWRPSWNGEDVAAPLSLPPPKVAFQDTAIVSGDFVGSQACASCHQAQYAAWSRSTHAAAGGAPGTVRVVASFNGPPIRFKDAEVIPAARGGRYTFTIRQRGRPDRVYRVDGVIGGGHMEGGGTQGFVTKMDDGTFRFLPFDFSRQGRTWFCNTIGRVNRGWVPITPELSLTACVDWPPVRVLGDESRFSNCASCHGSQISIRIDSAAQGFDTRFTSLGINCESCHGPGRRHLELVRDAKAVAAGTVGMAALATYSKDSSLGVCWQCHALKDRLRPGYLSGKPLESYYALRTPQLGDESYWPDGRVRTFAYQQGHWYSDCYVNGGMTCTSCHDPHSQTYRDVTGTPLVGRFDDRQCTSCHGSKAADPSAHTHHTAGSAGSRCVSCHMPYLQEPEIGTAITYRRSDHAIPIPRPAFDSTLGVISACKSCHADRSEAALDAQVTTWWGTLKPQARAIDAVVKTRTLKDRDAIGRLLLAPGERHTAALFDGLAWFVDHQLQPDMPELSRDLVARLDSLARHPDLDVRSLALAGLHYARGNDRSVNAVLRRALAAAGPTEPDLRSRWSVILGYLADKWRNGGQPAAAVPVYRKAIEVEPDNARLYLNLGISYAQLGDLGTAVAQYRRSLSIDPEQPLALINLGIALDEQGQSNEAAATYRHALAFNPRDALANFNLGNIYLKAGDYRNAATQYERAIDANPSLAVAHFYLARARLQLGDAQGALRETELGLEWEPANAEALNARDQLRRMLGR